MKQVALVLILAAGLGFVAGRHPVLPSDSRRSEPVRPALNSEAGPVETPLVVKLIPGGTAEPSALDAPPGIPDGQLSKRGGFYFDAARNVWAPVDKGRVRYTRHGRAVDGAHLISHGHHPSAVAKWTQAEREIAHANDHAAMSPARTRSLNVSQKTDFSNTSCPGGQCGNAAYRRGLLGRRR